MQRQLGEVYYIPIKPFLTFFPRYSPIKSTHKKRYAISNCFNCLRFERLPVFCVDSLPSISLLRIINQLGTLHIASICMNIDSIKWRLCIMAITQLGRMETVGGVKLSLKIVWKGVNYQFHQPTTIIKSNRNCFILMANIDSDCSRNAFKRPKLLRFGRCSFFSLVCIFFSSLLDERWKMFDTNRQ